MVIALDDGSASCVVEWDGKAVKFSLSSSSSVADLLTEVQSRINYDADLFELVLQNDSGHIGLSKLKDRSAEEAGVRFRPDCINCFTLVESPDSRIKQHDPPSIVISLVPQGDGKDDASSGTSTNSTSASDAERPPMVPLPSRFKKDSIRYVGLVNQAMTCYLNSLLQALFMTPEFRNGLYKWEFVGSPEEMPKSIPYQLQRLFLSLQTSKRSAVETTKLTRSFGWDSGEAWQQHDIQELCRVMFDALEQRFQNTDQADFINDLYEGKMIDYVKCLECSTEKSREDTFLDIPLPVRPFGSNVAYNSVEEALQAFVLPEILDGNNQYFCEKCNKKCDAHKGLKFSRFPYVLTLHLKRFDFDYSTMHRIKLNDKVEFPQTLNLNKFINRIGGNLASEQQESNGLGTLKKDDNTSTTDDEGCHGTDPADTPENMHGSTSGSNSSGSYADMQDYDEGIDLSSGISNHQQQENENRLHSEGGSGPPGPYVYELFSIMIHSGSASGGHYYAYIKDFNKGDWFCFNDQSVSRITNEDISRTYGGGANRSYYSGAHSSSTNAYMLMYRQIDMKRNVSAINVDEFPPHLQELLKRMQEEEEEELIRRERDKDRIKIKLYGRHPKDGKNLEKKLVLDYETTLSDATATAHALLYLDGVVPLEQCRLVHYNSCKSIIDCSFDDQDEEQIGDLLTHTSGLQQDSLFLEIRDHDAQFETYRLGGVVLKVYRVHMETGDVDPPVDIPTQMTATVETLKPQLAKVLKLNQNIRVMIEKYATRLVVLDDDKTLESAGFYSNKIFVAPVPENESDADFNNKMCEIVERFGHTITILCSLPETDRESLAKLGITPGTTDGNKMVNGDIETIESTSITRGTSRGTSPVLPPLPPPPALDPEEEGLGTTGCSDQSTSEDSSLTDSDRTIVGEEADFCLAELSSSSDSPQGSDQHNLSSPEDIDPAPLNKQQQEDCDQLDQIDPTHQSSYYVKIHPCRDQQELVRVQVGKRIMANVLKNALARHMNVGRDHIKLFRKCCRMDVELRDSITLHDEDHIYVRLERALRKGELRGKVFQLLAYDEPIKFLSDWILSKYMTVGEAKKQILDDLRSKEIIDLSCEKCRLRGKKWKVPGKIFLDTQTFQDLDFQQNWEMFLQDLPQGETVTNSSQVTVFVRRWLSSESKLDDYHEVTLQESSYDELREKLSETSGIPPESLKLARPSNVFPHNSFTNQQIQDELTWDTTCSCTLEDGAVLFYRDVTEEVKHTSDPTHRAGWFNTDEDAWFNRSKHGYEKRDEEEKPASEQTDEAEGCRSKYSTNIKRRVVRHTYSNRYERGLKIIVDNPTPPSHVEE